MSKLKQIILVKKIAENNGLPAVKQRSFYKLAKEAGYSESAAANPKRVLSTKSWNVLLQEELPDYVNQAKRERITE